MNNIMLDLETLDSSSKAVVISIGAVAFDPTGELGERFYAELTDDTSTQQRVGRVISGATVSWWMRQDVMAKQVFSSFPSPSILRYTTLDALTAFSNFVANNGGNDAIMWGNGADFDNVILGSLYSDFEGPCPWKFYNNRCYRTMKNIGIGPRRPRSHAGTKHNALDDAVTQAIHLQEIFTCLRSLKVQ
jgi:exodeoxyribonuclease VIII